MSKHLPRIASGVLLLSFLTAGLSVAREDIQRRLTSISNGSPAVLSTALTTDTHPNVAPMQDNSWYVIAGSYPENQRRQANAQAARLRAQGFNMNVYNSSAYAGLTHGLLVVMDGPYSRRQAQRILNNVRSVVRGAYIKIAHYPD